MTAQISSLWNAFNTPYQKLDESDLYDLSPGASYSFTTDAKNWATSFAITLLFISKILPYVGLADPFPLTLMEGLTILSTSTAATALTKRIIGFTHDKETDQVVQRSLVDFIAYGAYFAVILYAIPRISQISIERMSTLAMKTVWPPVIASLYRGNNSNLVEETQVNKVKTIAEDYAKHHANIMKLNARKQQHIYLSMFAQGLETPKEVIQDKPAVLQEMKWHERIFQRIDPKENETPVWVREKISNFIQTFGFAPLPSIEEQNEEHIDMRLKTLNLHKLQWVVLSLASSKDAKLESGDFNKLKARANNITEADSTGLVGKLKRADSLEHLKAMVG